MTDISFYSRILKTMIIFWSFQNLIYALKSATEPPSKLICVDYDVENTTVPEKEDACEQKGQRMLVEEVHLAKEDLDSSGCDEDNRLTGTPLNLSRANHKLKGQQLKEACNGNRRCNFNSQQLGIFIDNEDDIYKSYIVRYSCRQFKSDGDTEKSAINIVKRISREKEAKSTLVLKRFKQYSRQCSVTTTNPDGNIYLRLLWINFYKSKSVFRVSSNFTTVLEVDGLNETYLALPNLTYTFKNDMDIQISGEKGFVWLEISATTPYTIHCWALKEDFSFIRIVSTESPIKSTVCMKNNDTTQEHEPDDGFHQLVIAITSTIAVVATVIVIVLIFYICYFRRNSRFRRWQTTRRAQRHQGLHQQQQQQQQQQPQTYDEYTNIDESYVLDAIPRRSDIPICGRQDLSDPTARAMKTVPSSSTSNFTAVPDNSIYSLTYTATEQSRSSNEYNKMGANSPDNSNDSGDIYDTTETVDGGYSTFSDTFSGKHVMRNLYDG